MRNFALYTQTYNLPPLTSACEIYMLFYALWGSKPTHALADEQLTV